MVSSYRVPDRFSDAVVGAVVREDRFLTAIELARQGFRVLPVCCIDDDGMCSCGKEECRAPGKHPLTKLTPNGVLDASNDFETVRDWFALHHPMNIGLRMGDGLVALDLDPRAGIDLRDTFGLPQTNTEVTGGDGEHRFYREPRGMTLRSRKARGQPEMKARGSYVVVSPGNHVSGGRYFNPEPGRPFATIPRDWPRLTESAVETRLLRKLEALSDPQPRHYQEAKEIWSRMIEGRYAENLILLQAGRWQDVFDGAGEPRYPSQSEADASFLFAGTVFTTNPRVLDALLRDSGLIREKWISRPDYRAIQITYAIEGRRRKSTSLADEVRWVLEDHKPGDDLIVNTLWGSEHVRHHTHSPFAPQVPKEDVLDRTLPSSAPRRRARDDLIRDILRFGLRPPMKCDRGNGWVRFPVEEIASVRRVNPKTVQRAVKDAEDRGLIETDVFRFEFHGHPRCDRLIRVRPHEVKDSEE